MTKSKKAINTNVLEEKLKLFFQFTFDGYSNSASRAKSKIRVCEHNYLMETNIQYIKVTIANRKSPCPSVYSEKHDKTLYNLENPKPKIDFTTENCELLLPVGIR